MSSSSSDSEGGAHRSAPSDSEQDRSNSSDSDSGSDDGAPAEATMGKAAMRKAAAAARRAEGMSTEHEAAQLVVLGQLLAEKAARDPRFQAPILTTKDRKYRNTLEKKLRKELGWPRPDGTPWPAKPSKADKAKRKAEKAAALEAKARAKLAGYLAAGLLPDNLKEVATALSQKGRNPFKTEDDGDADAAAAAASADSLAPLTSVELKWAKTQLRNERRALKASEEELRSKQRNREKRKAVAERYRLPPEMHIPQELVIANPEANALRLEKESKLFKYKRNAPNYQELVAKVREDFLLALPSATGAGGASGADGNVGSVHSGWDLRTKFVAEFTAADEEAAINAATAAAEAAKAKAKAVAAEEEPPKKKSKKSKTADAAAAAAPPLPLLHQSYHPRFVSSFSWLPEQPDLRKADINPLDPSSVLSYTASRMVQPGAPYAYLRPALPLVFRPNQKGFAVDKPDIVALIMAARVAGITFEEGSSTAAAKTEDAAAAAGEMADDESEDEEAQRKRKKQLKKEKKQREKAAAAAASEIKVKAEPRDADGDESMAASAASSSSGPLRFVSYRNNYRKFFNRKEFWRVDVQRVGRTIFLRRHLNYNFVNPFDVGHLFEQACKEDNVIAAMAEANGVAGITKYAAAGFAKREGRTLRDLAHKEDSTTHPYRAIVQTKLREFELITSIEIDLCQKNAPASTAAASSSSSATAAPAAAASSDPLSTFLELKTVPKHRWTLQKKADVWVQTFLGGVPRTIVGLKEDYRELDEKAKKKLRKEERRAALMNNEEYKYDSLKKQKSSKRAGSSAVAQVAAKGPPAVQVTDILEARTEHLIDTAAKEKLMGRFYAMLQFVAANVKEGRVYKLEHRKKAEAPADAAKSEIKSEATGASQPFVHPSRMAATSAAAAASSHASYVASQDSLNLHPSHMENWEILLEELPDGLHAQPVIVPGVLAQVDAWAEMWKIQQAQEAEQKAKEDAEAAAAKAAKAEKKKSKKKKSSSSSSKSDKKKDKDGKSSKKKKKRKERDEDSATVDGDGSSTSKKKKKSRTDSSSDDAAAAAPADSEAASSEKTKSKKSKKSSKSEKKSKKEKTRKGSKRKERPEDAAAAATAVKKEAAAAADSSSDSESD